MPLPYPTGYEFIRLVSYDPYRPKTPKDNYCKIPIEAGWTTAKSLSRADVENILRLGGNYGCRLRACDLVIDVDPRNGGTIDVLGFDISAFPVVLTPSGGVHIYTALPDGVQVHHTVKMFPGIEFKSLGRQVVGPGSIHPNGGVYDWDLFAGSFPAALTPNVLLSRIIQQAQEAGPPGEWSPEQLGMALGKLDVTAFAQNDAWFGLMAAAHEATGGLGEDEFTDWSINDPLYCNQEKIVRQRWQSLRAGKSGNAGAGTLLHILIAHGVTDVPRGPMTDFDGCGDETPAALADDEDTAKPSHLPFPPEPTKIKTRLEDMNERFYVVQEDGKLRVLELRRSDELDTMEWIRHGKQDFIEVAQSVYHYPMTKVSVTNPDTGKTKETILPLAKRWIETNIKGKRVFPGGVVFRPEINTERVGDSLNLWRGFAVEPKPGCWALLQELILESLCRNDRESFEYVLNWLARSIQAPHIPAGTAIVFKGVKGTGKGTLGRAFVKLFGAHGKQITSMGAITGRFNAHLQDCVAMFADEAYWAGDRSAEGTFQALITEPEILFEAKGLTPRKGRNCIHILMASNRDWVVPAGLDSERRYAVFECMEEKKSRAFFDALNKEMEDGGYSAMLWDLQRRDIHRFHVGTIPNTQALAEQKMESMEQIEQWFHDLVNSENWNGCRAIDNEEITYLALDFQRNYEDYIGYKRDRRSAATQVGIVLKKFVPGFKKIRMPRPDDRIDIAALRPWAYILPSIEEARIKFMNSIGQLF